MRLLPIVFLLLLRTSLLPAQSAADKEKAMELGRSAIEKMEAGDISEALRLLGQSAALDPGNEIYPYETGYAHYLAQDYPAAIKVLKKLTKKPGAGKQVYSLLGNAYDLADDQKKAVKTYESGIKAYPESGIFYVELGILEGRRENWDQAVAYWEQGVRTEPNYPSNYFHLANLFSRTPEHIWTVLYGETFINLEPGTARTEAMSETIYVAYRNAIELKGDSAEVHFARNMNMTVTDLMSLKLPAPMVFGLGMTFGTTSVTGETDVNSTTLSAIREGFLQFWEEKEHAATYPNILIDRQQKIRAAGHLEAYNHWLFSDGDPVGWEFWADSHEDEFKAFIDWFLEHPLDIPRDRVLVRGSF